MADYLNVEEWLAAKMGHLHNPVLETKLIN